MKIKIVFIIATATCVVFSTSCQTPQESSPKYMKDGKQYGVVKGLFRDRWWNFYERGISFAEGEFWQEAISDFKAAINQREKDQRRARTYGMHFADYFPHRELGIVYYFLGRYTEAEEELKNSLSTEDTGKAKFYLNKVRKVLIEASKEDTAAPKIRVASFAEGEITNRFNLDVIGEVEDDTYAYQIAVNENPLFIELSSKKIPFSKEINLKKGLNEITIKTSDILGKVTEKKVKVFGDFEGPSLNIRDYTDGQEVAEKKVLLHGTLTDATGITTLKINDQILVYNKEREVTFSVTLDLKEGKNSVMLAATDVAGNTTTGTLNLVCFPKMANARNLAGTSTASTRRKKRPIRLAFYSSGIVDAGHNFLFSAFRTKQPQSAFRLSLKDLTDTQTVYYETMYLDGFATGGNEIRAVKINGSPLIVVPGKTVYFGRLIKLRKGKNVFKFEVEDKKGKTLSKSITIVHVVPKVHQIRSRMSLAIMPFVKKGETSMVSGIVYDNLVNGFVGQERFNIVSRGEEFEAVLREMKLSRTDLVDKNTAVKLGKIVAAEAVMMGTILETQEAVEIYARLVNTETSTILEAKDVYGQDKSLSHIRYLVNGLALKFKHSFPVLEGLVIKISGKKIYADLGKAHKIKKEMKFIIFREGEAIVHSVTGKMMGRETEELGVATVLSVFEDMSMGKLRAASNSAEILLKDLVITK